MRIRMTCLSSKAHCDSEPCLLPFLGSATPFPSICLPPDPQSPSPPNPHGFPLRKRTVIGHRVGVCRTCWSWNWSRVWVRPLSRVRGCLFKAPKIIKSIGYRSQPPVMNKGVIVCLLMPSCETRCARSMAKSSRCCGVLAVVASLRNSQRTI